MERSRQTILRPSPSSAAGLFAFAGQWSTRFSGLNPASTKPLIVLSSFAVILGQTQTANAQEANQATSEVASSFEADDPFDLFLGLDYSYLYKRAAIVREWGRDNRTQWAKDLWYQQSQHILTPSLEIGLFRGISAYLRLPVILQDRRKYEFDQTSAENCTYPDESTPARPANCVNKTNSSTLRDGILSVNGYDATSPRKEAFSSYTSDQSKTIMTAPIRRGIDQLHAGLKFALLDQNKKPHVPTLILGLESRIALGPAMQLTKSRHSPPSSNHLVGRKIHEFGFWTAIRRRLRLVEPYASAYFRYAATAKGSIFDTRGTAAQQQRPQSRAGASLGVQITPWFLPQKDLKVSIDLRASLDHHFRGHGYSEIWELTADSPALVGKDPSASGACSIAEALRYAGTHPKNPSNYLEAANLAANSGRCERFSGLTAIEAFSELGGRAALNLQLGAFTQVSLGAHLNAATTHRVSGAAHKAAATNKAPTYRAVIDQAGRRYAVDDIMQVRAFTELKLLF